MDKLLVVSKDPLVVNSLTGISKRFLVVQSDSGITLDILKSQTISAILLDLHLAGIQAPFLVRAIKTECGSHIPILILYDNSEIEMAIESMRLGAYDIISKPVDGKLLEQKMQKALERRELEVGMNALQNSFAEQHDRIVFFSETMKRTNYEITRLANIDFDLLLIGETGVGKDLAAFEIHERSKRRGRLFIPIAIRSLNETLIESELFGHEKGAFTGADKAKVGKLEAANGGTVYLPEVSSLSESVQLKLLQFMQYKTISRVGGDPRKPEAKIDVRIIMATNDSPEELVGKGRMREDFYHRISGVTLRIPPLRERPDDIEPLVNYFLDKFSHGAGYSVLPEVFAVLKTYTWSGNVRELENSVKSALAHASSKTLTLQDFPVLLHRMPPQEICEICMSTKFPQLPNFKNAKTFFKRAYLQEVLKRSQSNIERASRIAGITPQGLRKVLRTLDMN